jgi:type IV/VI secretion system ImpK/VasF family protein
MKNKFWGAVHEVYTRMEEQFGRSLFHADPLDSVAEKPVDRDEGPPVTSEDLIRVRAELRTQLDFLKATLEEQFSERDSYLILFAVVAQIDEAIQIRFMRSLNTAWPLLQKELFQIDNAGEVFYEILDDILLKPQTPLFVKEVYYFCLRYGFSGRYLGNPVKLQDYQKKLETGLEQVDLKDREEALEGSGSVRDFRSPYWSYLITVGVVFVGYVLLLLLGKNHL